jgi:hypothetical protein
MYNISKEDFVDHVSQVKNWKDLGIRCGVKQNRDGKISNWDIILQLKKKVINMRLNVDHFHVRGQFEFPDNDIFIKMVEESDCFEDIAKKCLSVSGNHRNRAYFNRRIQDLCIDTSHWKITPIHNRKKKMNMIDDETLKTILKNSINWGDLYQKCGYTSSGSETVKNTIMKRIQELGLDMKHLDHKGVTDDKIFVVESQFQTSNTIKKRLVRDFGRPYECSACKNVNFTKRDGVLMWNGQEIILQLEHKNGINNDNRLENLEFLCPNCHSQTSTFCGRNLKRLKVMNAWVEDGKIEHPPGASRHCSIRPGLPPGAGT